jgi:hypothetical protein
MTLRWLALGLVPFALIVPSLASADDCPAGSKQKSEGGFTWCEPTVCMTDGNCSPSEVCRPVPLCVEVGKLDDQKSTKDAAQKLVATQRCAPDETCPSTQTCSKMSRCVSKAQADKMGMASAPSAGASASATPASGDAKKSACGCVVVGARAGGATALAGLGGVLLGLAAIGSRKIHRPRRKPAAKR